MQGCEGNRISHHHHHHDHHDLIQKKPFGAIKQSEDNNNNKTNNNKSFSRLLSKEASQPNSSCRVYYGETAVAIPFVWESQPGTPKHTLFEASSLPPLTPPPSFSAAAASKSRHRSAAGKPKLDALMSSIFPRSMSAAAARARRLSQASSAFSLSSLSSSSSSTSSSASWSGSSSARARVSRTGAPAESYGPEFDDDRDSGGSPAASPTSTLCFPAVKKTAWRFVAGCYATVKVKNGRFD